MNPGTIFTVVIIFLLVGMIAAIIIQSLYLLKSLAIVLLFLAAGVLIV